MHHEPLVHHEVTHSETHYDMAPESLTHHKRFSFSKAQAPEEKKPAEAPKEEEQPKKEEKTETTPPQTAEKPKDDKKVKVKEEVDEEEDERLVGKRSDFDLTDKQKKDLKEEAEPKAEVEEKE